LPRRFARPKSPQRCGERCLIVKKNLKRGSPGRTAAAFLLLAAADTAAMKGFFIPFILKK
jgi:hypothetical protein